MESGKVKGLHLPNKDIDSEELKRIVALSCTDYVDLDLWPWRWKYLKSLQSDCKIHVRIYSRGTLTPNDDARACATLINDHSEIDTIRIRNEPNIETLHITPDMWYKYLDSFLSTYRNDKLSIPAFSPGLHGWEAYAKISSDLARKYNLNQLDAHIYGNVGEFEETLRKLESLWQGNLLITEHNFGAGREYSISQWAADYINISNLLNYHPNVKLFSEFIWEWDNPDTTLPTSVNIKDTLMEKVISKQKVTTTSVPANYSSPNTDGPRKETKLIVLHGTQGKLSNLYAEWLAAFRWHCNPVSKVSSHAVVGPNVIGYPVKDDYIAWHCRELNSSSIGIEIVQPFPDSIIPIDIQKEAAKLVAKYCVKYNIPIVWSTTHGICEHFETPPGRREGKTDLNTIPRESFLNLVKSYAFPPVQDGQNLSEQRIRELKVLPEWYLACVRAKEDWTKKSKGDFINHLKGIGADYANPERYGWR